MKFTKRTPEGGHEVITISKKKKVIWALVFALVAYIYFSPSDANKYPLSETDAYIKERMLVVDNLKDPDSFEVVNYVCYRIDSNTVKVLLKYRAKNGFGAFVVESSQHIWKADGTYFK